MSWVACQVLSDAACGCPCSYPSPSGNVISFQQDQSLLRVTTAPPPESLQIVIALSPFLIVYLFLQKHFNKGVING